MRKKTVDQGAGRQCEMAGQQGVLLDDYASQEKAALHVFQTVVGKELQLKCASEDARPWKWWSRLLKSRNDTL